MTNWQSLADKRGRVLRRLMRGDGKSFAEIDQFFAGDPDLISSTWERYQAMTKAQRDRLFANADRLKRGRDKGSPVQVQDEGRRGRGPGKVSAGESFTLVLPPDLLARYRDLAFREQRSVAQVIRLAMLAYLTSLE